MKIYADEIFALNAFSAAMLIYSYFIINKLRPPHKRIVAACALCGVYAVSETIFGLPRLLRVAVLAAMAYTVFKRGGVIRHTALLMLICFAVEGITLAAVSVTGAAAELAQGGVTLFASEPVTAAFYILSYPTFIAAQKIRNRRKKYRKLSVTYRDRKIETEILYDSGNLLKYHGKPVIMIAWEAAAPLFDCEDFDRLRDTSEAYVIYETINGGGAVPVIEPERCAINGSEVNAAVAVVARKFKGKYCGIAGDI